MAVPFQSTVKSANYEISAWVSELMEMGLCRQQTEVERVMSRWRKMQPSQKTKANRQGIAIRA